MTIADDGDLDRQGAATKHFSSALAGCDDEMTHWDADVSARKELVLGPYAFDSLDDVTTPARYFLK